MSTLSFVTGQQVAQRALVSSTQGQRHELFVDSLRRLSKAEFLGQTLGDELAALSSMTSVAKSGLMYLDKPQRGFAWF